MIQKNKSNGDLKVSKCWDCGETDDKCTCAEDFKKLLKDKVACDLISKLHARESLIQYFKFPYCLKCYKPLIKINEYEYQGDCECSKKLRINIG